MNYYNDNSPEACAWLRELITAKLIPDGHVDNRSITEVQPGDLDGYTQCHFFAGIGGWPYALQLAGWPEDRPVWTGSCPCQPFSVAGQRRGTQDERHLWPEFRRLITERHPANVFGEQVASKDGRVWLAGIRTDLETLGYAVGGTDLCAAGVGAPHIRQRLFWVAEPRSQSARRELFRSGESLGAFGQRAPDQPGGSSGSGRVAHSSSTGLEIRSKQPARQEREAVERSGPACGVGHFVSDRKERSGREEREPHATSKAGGLGHSVSPRLKACGTVPITTEARSKRSTQPGAWSHYDLIPCRDGKTRRVESGTFPLAHGVPGRVGLLRGYGNAIVPQVAAEFITAYLETTL